LIAYVTAAARTLHERSRNLAAGKKGPVMRTIEAIGLPERRRGSEMREEVTKERRAPWRRGTCLPGAGLTPAGPASSAPRVGRARIVARPCADRGLKPRLRPTQTTQAVETTRGPSKSIVRRR